MSDDPPPDDAPADRAGPAPTATTILVPRALLEQVYAHLTAVYASYRTRKLRQAIMIIEHILGLRP